MGDPDFNAQFISQLLQVFFEDIMTGTVAPTTIAERQNCSRIQIEQATMLKPPRAKAIAGKLTGVLACADVDVADSQPSCCR
jgi:hypothetical protein